MISATAVTLALAFWAPYNGGQPVCPDGVQVVYDASTPDANLGWVEPQDMAAGNCRFHILASAGDWPVSYQCGIIAHELGHAALGLPDDPWNPGIMHYGPGWQPPGICYPGPPHKGQVEPLATSRPSARHVRFAARRAAKLLGVSHLKG